MRTKHTAPSAAVDPAPPVVAATPTHPIRFAAGAPAGTVSARVIQ